MWVKYVAYTWAGARVTGTLDVASTEAAEEQIRAQQLVPFVLQVVVPKRSLVQVMPGLFRPKEQLVIDFTQQLATLLRSGIPLASALRSLREGTRNAGLKEALRAGTQDIEAGTQFSAACARHPTVFPPFYTRLLRVGEAAGELSLILVQLAKLLERRQMLKARVRRALVYPAMALSIGAVATFVLVTYSLPALINLLSEFGGELPTATRLLMGGASFLKAYGIFGMGGAALLAILGWLFGRTARGAELRDRTLLRAPVIGTIILTASMFSLMSTLGTLLRGGVASIESLQLAGREMGNTVVRRGMERVAAAVESGERLSRAFANVTVFPPLLAQAARSGETAGILPQVVEGLAEYYAKELDRVVSGAVELIQPVVLVVVAGLVGFVAVAVLSGIYSTLGSVK